MESKVKGQIEDKWLRVKEVYQKEAEKVYKECAFSDWMAWRKENGYK